MTSTERFRADIAALDGIDVELDALHDVLAHPRRRFILAFLQKYGKPMALADVADALATWEGDSSNVQPAKDRVKSVYIALHHAHVPKMVDVGIIEHNQGRNTIALVENSEEITRAAELPQVG